MSLTAAPSFAPLLTVAQGQGPSTQAAAPKKQQPILSVRYTDWDGTVVTLTLGMRVKIVAGVCDGYFGTIVSFVDSGTAEVFFDHLDGGSTFTTTKNAWHCVPM